MYDLNRTLGGVIAELRRSNGVSQERLAFECDLHRTYISQLERGIKSPTIGVLFQIANALKARPSDIVKRVEETQCRRSIPREII